MYALIMTSLIYLSHFAPWVISRPFLVLSILSVLALAASRRADRALMIVIVASLFVSFSSSLSVSFVSYGFPASSVKAIYGRVVQDCAQKTGRMSGYRLSLMAAEDGKGSVTTARGSIYVLSEQSDLFTGDEEFARLLLSKGYAILHTEAPGNEGGFRKKHTEDDIRRALVDLGKLTKADELNCGGCGYNTCREMAIAYLDGMAEIEMCVTKMRKEAESKVDVLLRTIPTGVVIVDSDLQIADCNKLFLELFGDMEDGFVDQSILQMVKGLPLERFVPFADKSNILLQQEMRSCQSVAIHVRKGNDYRTRSWYVGTCPAEYYRKAVAMFREKLSAPRFYVFTDNPAWVRENFTDFPYTLVEGNPTSGYGSHFDMQLMSSCQHNIISNSTYSWWGAFLNPNPGKSVVLPRVWFNPESCEEYTSGRICCKGWLPL